MIQMRLIAPFMAVLATVLCAAPAVAAPAYDAQATLLVERVGQISDAVPSGRYPLGTGLDGRLRFALGSEWTSGFWAGTLWRVADLTGLPEASAQARAATIDHLGFEKTKLHDLGFMYGESSVAAYERLCRPGPDPDCARLRASGLAAADTLLRLAATTGQRIIPVGARTCSDCPRGGSETIVDSMMNLPLLLWASRETGRERYRSLAVRHAGWVARNLVRRDGSTYQAARYRRSARRPRLLKHTHQGLRNSSVWSRGQSWSVYGFAVTGKALRNRRLIAVAERNALWIARHLPADGLPAWDYRAPGAAPRDVSAGVIGAAGLFHLAAACREIEGACDQPERWEPLAGRMLSGSLSRLRTSGPPGYLGNQVYTLGGRTAWDDDCELIFGLDYALEAIALARGIGA